jgi:hypothetical protein
MFLESSSGVFEGNQKGDLFCRPRQFGFREDLSADSELEAHLFRGRYAKIAKLTDILM